MTDPATNQNDPQASPEPADSAILVPPAQEPPKLPAPHMDGAMRHQAIAELATIKGDLFRLQGELLASETAPAALVGKIRLAVNLLGEAFHDLVHAKHT